MKELGGKTGVLVVLDLPSAGMINVKDLEVWRLVRVIHVRPMYLTKSLKAEKHAQLWETREIAVEGCLESLLLV